ncbi:hypothetical protein [Streptomyces mirabilis]|uniref:hypothetical protein n=1 Tax=Streptomyces mirabilis TaxID=68239 RepID=UPI00365389C1
MALPDDDFPLVEVRLRFARAVSERRGLAPPTPFAVPRPGPAVADVALHTLTAPRDAA